MLIRERKLWLETASSFTYGHIDDDHDDDDDDDDCNYHTILMTQSQIEPQVCLSTVTPAEHSDKEKRRHQTTDPT